MGTASILSWKCKWKWKWKRTTPLLFQSKQLCLSILYLITTLCITFYVSISPSPFKCFLIYYTKPSDHLFSYPSTYGEHKHSLPTSSPFSCNTPLVFPDYRSAYEDIRELCNNHSSSTPSSVSSDLKYLSPANGKAGTFAGNYSVKRRRSFFDYREDMRIPCGFLTEFPLTESDRSAMNECRGVVVASAIFGDYDKIRQPKGLADETLRWVCFFMFADYATIRALNSHNIIPSPTVGVWRIVTLQTKKLPYSNPAMNGVIPKHLMHRLFPNAKFSVWVDAKLQLTVDPLLLVHSLLVSKGVDMAISKHPFNVHTIEEAMATARWNKWGCVEELRVQMETYCENGLQPWTNDKLPYESDVPDTALILRRHGLRSNLFSCLLFNELEAFNPRDQLAFAYVRDFMNPKLNLHMFQVEVFEHIAIEYRHNLKPITGKRAKELAKNKISLSSTSINDSKCRDYLIKMWGESAAD